LLCKCHLPAEWERHEATWIGWPHERTDWPGKMGAVRWAYAEIARKIAPGEILRIVVESPEHEARARQTLIPAGVDESRVEFFRIPTNRGWLRDSGPLFLTGADSSGAPQIAAARFRFNAWAKYSDWQRDDRLPEAIATALDIPLLPVEWNGKPVVLEGGSIDVNDRGALITTEECLLDPQIQVRNPGFTRGDFENVFRSALGTGQVIWLGRGIAGDDTHGHVDDLCRFTGPARVVLCQESDAGDANYRPLQENRERLEGVRLEDGARLEVIPIPMPAPLFFKGQRLPASYANFYIANAAVLVPTFNNPNDRVALGILADLFPDRPVVGIHAVDLVWGLGTIHCLTREQPVR